MEVITAVKIMEHSSSNASDITSAVNFRLATIFSFRLQTFRFLFFGEEMDEKAFHQCLSGDSDVQSCGCEHSHLQVICDWRECNLGYLHGGSYIYPTLGGCPYRTRQVRRQARWQLHLSGRSGLLPAFLSLLVSPGIPCSRRWSRCVQLQRPERLRRLPRGYHGRTRTNIEFRDLSAGEEMGMLRRRR